jgi:preprotein translocase subunit SecA
MYGRRNAVLRDDNSAVREYLAEILASAPKDDESVGSEPAGEVPVEKLLENASPEYLANIRRLILQTIDMFWIDHLEMMDYMRSSVNLRAYGQRDPLVEYKREGLKLFKDMEFSIGAEIIKMIPQIQQVQIKMEAPVKIVENLASDSAATSAVANNILKVADTRHATPDGKKIGRNDPCWCGSNKKFKHCHGK